MSQYGFSEDLMLKILKKLKVPALVRMRKTCSFVNNLAEKKRKELASRPAFGDWLVFEINWAQLCFGRGRDAPIVKLVEGEFEKQISGISFRTIRIDIEEFPNVDPLRNRAAYLRIIEILKKNEIVCGEFYPGDCPLDLTVPLTNSLKWTDRIHMGSFISKQLSTSENWSIMTISCEGVEVNEGILEKINGSSEVSLSSDVNGFQQLIKDIEKSKERIRMKSITVHFERPLLSIFECPSLPSFQEIREPPRPLKAYKNIPEPVRLLTLPSQFVFIEEYLRYTENKHRVDFSFVDRNAAAFEEKLISIYYDPSFDPADGDDYFSDEEEESDLPKDFNDYVRFIASSIIG